MEPFSYFKQDGVISISGDFRSGKHFEQVKEKLEDSISINLTEVVFMDSDTMNFIYNYTGDVIWKKDSFVLNNYLIKFKEI